MPYRSGLIQTAIGALFAATFVISNAFSTAPSKQKRLAGVIEKVDTTTLHLTETTGRKHRLSISSATTIFLNDRAIQLSQVENGRNAAVFYEKTKKHMLVKKIEIFPNHTDFASDFDRAPSV